MKHLKTIALSALLITPALYGASVAACTGCHGQQFEKAAMGKSKIVKDMGKEEIVAALKGYKDGSYGGPMKAMMVGQVASLDDAGIEGIASMIKGGTATPTDKATENAAAAAVAEAQVIDINKNACDPKRIAEEDLAKKKSVSEETLGLRNTNLYSEADTMGEQTDYHRPPPGASTRFERAYVNAPPMIPHDVEGMMPITKESNQCVGCHMPEVASSMGATPIPPSHFTNFRPTVELKNGEVLHEGKAINKDIPDTGAIKTVAHKTNGLYQGRFNCSQCHAPQSKTEVEVANTFRPDFKDGKEKTASDLIDSMNEGVE